VDTRLAPATLRRRESCRGRAGGVSCWRGGVAAGGAGPVAVAYSARVAVVRWGRARGCEGRGPRCLPSAAQARVPAPPAQVQRCYHTGSRECGTRKSGTCSRGRMPDSKPRLLSSRACCSEYPRSGAYNLDTPPFPSTGRGADSTVSRADSNLQMSVSGRIGAVSDHRRSRNACRSASLDGLRRSFPRRVWSRDGRSAFRRLRLWDRPVDCYALLFRCFHCPSLGGPYTNGIARLCQSPEITGRW
jgi:hypothetical protein